MYSVIRTSEGFKRSAQDVNLFSGTYSLLSGCYWTSPAINVRPFLNHKLWIQTGNYGGGAFLEVIVQGVVPNYIAQTVQETFDNINTGWATTSFGGNSPNLTGQIYDWINIVLHAPAGTTADIYKVVILSQ